jgi:Flp pilus assembly protein TadG
MNRKHIGRTKQRGVAAIEFAIVVPLCLFLFLAVSEFGRAIWQYNTLTHAIRDAVRYAASNALQGQAQVVNVDAQLISEVGNVAAFGMPVGSAIPLLPGLTPANFTVTNEGGGIISVTATYPYQPLLGAVLPQVMQSGTINSAFTMRAQVTMRAIG